jgi:hypothetical protein
MGSRSLISLLWAPKWRLQGLLETLFRQFLRQQILEFIEYFNRTMAKPFKWTYNGQPLKV